LPEFTHSQLKAINARDNNILVSAAAGSGKTAVLVERIIRIITDTDNPVNINELLVVTFTDAAAGEMRERISKALSERIKNDSSNTHLKNQLILMPTAQISTLHSFCSSVIRNNFVAAGVDPQFRVGENTEIGIIKESILDELFNKEYELKNVNFYRLLDIFSDRFFDTGLRELVLRLYEFSRSFLEPEKWLSESSENFNCEDLSCWENNIWSKLALDEIKSRIKSSIDAANSALVFCEMENGPFKYKDIILADIEMLEDIYSKCSLSFSKIASALESISFQKLASITAKDNVDADLKEIVKAIREKNIKQNIALIQEKYFFKPSEDMAKDTAELYPILNKLTEMVIEFGKQYSLEKTDNNILDFSDLEHFSYKILKENDEIADYYKQLFFEIYTDEYQDSNIIQEELLNLIARENNRFMVGDVKQSIYKFRRANPAIFIDKYNSYKNMEDCLRIDLSTNFRSRKNVLAGANFLFKQLMSEESSSIDYGEAEMLYYGAPYPDNDQINDNTELIIIETKSPEKDDLNDEIINLSNAEKEALAIAERIKQMTKGEEAQLVFDKNTGDYRKAEYGDITILLRSLTDAATIVHILAKEGIPAHANTSGGYFGNIEVLIMLSLLRVIDNPLQDISLLSVLHSPLYGFSADDLAKIRSLYPKGNYYNAIASFMEIEDSDTIKNKLYETTEKFLADLNRWRKLKSQLPVSKLISTLFDETGYFDYISLLPDAEIKQANLMALFEHALQFEKTSLQGIFRFIRYIEKLIERDSDVKDAQVVSEKSNIVQIMTIHKSKGLEFPICFVANLGKKINRRDEYASLVLHEDYGFGPIYLSPEPRIRSNTLAKSVLSDKLHKENYSEELRILYVALTRAKDKLILTGCVNSFEKAMAEWVRNINITDEKLPAHYIFDSNSYLSWIGACIARHNSFSNRLSFDFPPACSTIYNDFSGWKVSVINSSEYILSDSTIVETEIDFSDEQSDNFDYEKYNFFYEKISENFSWKYENLQYTFMPAKISISEIKRNYFSQMKIIAEGLDNSPAFAEPTFDVPDFIDKDKKLNAAEKGTAMHTVMEHLNIREIKSKEDIVNLVKTLLEGNLLNQKQAASVNIDKIFSFVISDLGKRMKNALELEKEVPFVLEIDAANSYLPNVKEGTLMVHGIIDCYFVEDDRIILVDYKSDYVGKANLEEVKERYKIQLDIYKQALESSLGLEVGQVLLYLFDIDTYVNMF